MSNTERQSHDEERLRREYDDALERAKSGDPASRLEVGRLLFEGIGVKRNRGEAAAWFEKGFRAYQKLAETGDPDALFALGECYDDGTGVFRDDREATELFRKAAEAGHAGAAYRLGVRSALGLGAPRDAEAAYLWYKTAAEKGNADSCRALALALERGEGCEPDPAEALRWHQKAADGGVGLSALDLGRALLTGRGRDRDIPGAISYFVKAYESGVPAAAADLGLFYYNAEGESENAALWLARAVDAGQPNATLPYADLLRSGRGVARNPIREAAFDGNAEAQFELGRIYYDGIGVGADREKGIRWWKESAYNGCPPARRRLAELGFSEADWADPDELYDDDDGFSPGEE